MITPRFQYVVQLLLHMFYNILTQYQYIRLFLCSHVRPDRPFNSTYQRLHQVTFVNKFKGHIFYRLLILVEHRIKQHRFKINISLVDGHRLELQFDRTVLYRNTRIDLFDQRHFQIKSRTKNAAELSEDSNYAYSALFYGHK